MYNESLTQSINQSIDEQRITQSINQSINRCATNLFFSPLTSRKSPSPVRINSLRSSIRKSASSAWRMRPFMSCIQVVCKDEKKNPWKTIEKTNENTNEINAYSQWFVVGRHDSLGYPHKPLMRGVTANLGESLQNGRMPTHNGNTNFIQSLKLFQFYSKQWKNVNFTNIFYHFYVFLFKLFRRTPNNGKL